MNKTTEQQLKTFINEWDEDSGSARKSFILFKNHLSNREGVSLEFMARPGITSSLRAVHNNQEVRKLFVMVDVIEDSSRWLSVCFYGDMISDPQEKGDRVPGGLLGEDAICFDLEEPGEEQISYLIERLDEAYNSAVSGK